MVVTLDLPDEARARLEAKATRRGITLEELIAQLAAQLPAQPNVERRHRLSFVGIGASGDTRPLDIRRERAELAERKRAKGI
jgi:hypothetical protein